MASKITLLLVSLLQLVTVFCQQTSSQCGKVTTGNIVRLEFECAKKYITNYRNNHSDEFKTHTNAIFIPSGTFSFIADFFNAPAGKSFDGINIHFVHYNKLLAKGQSDQYQIALYFTAAKKDNNDNTEPIQRLSDFDALRSFYDAMPAPKPSIDAINHAELYAYRSDSTFAWSNTPLPVKPTVVQTAATDNLMFANKDLVNEYRERYRSEYCFLNWAYTKTMFLHRDNFLFLKDFFRLSNEYTGIKIYFAAYNDFKVWHQARAKQITLVFTPVKADKEPDFGILNTLYNNNQKLFLSIFGEEYTKSLNHGELCPYNCPPKDQ